MRKKRIYIFGSISLLAASAVFFHAQQVWPVQNREVIGVYQNTRNPKDKVYLRSNGDYEHDTGQQKYVGKWSINKWDGDVSLLNVDFTGVQELNSSYIVGSRFGRVENLYITNKSSEEWRKTAK